MKKKIVVAVDETESSKRASDFVNRFFTPNDAHVVAVNVATMPAETIPAVPYGRVYGWPWYREANDPASQAELLERTRHEAETLASRHTDAGAKTDVRFGEATDAILAAADDHDADLIVVGSNHKGFFERLFAGSVSQELVREASRPVLVVP